jgi:hypothetical protein
MQLVGPHTVSSRNESKAIRLARIDANKCPRATMLAGTAWNEPMQLALSHGIEAGKNVREPVQNRRGRMYLIVWKVIYVRNSIPTLG